MTPRAKTIFLVRHAHRDTSDPTADNGLSDKGRDQAKAVDRAYKKIFGKTPALLLSSPKRRCLETLAPLAKRLGAPIQRENGLLEGSYLEARVEEFLSWWKRKAPDLVVACSHGDWIPAFLHAALGVSLPVNKGSWVELIYEKRRVRLGRVRQSLP